MIDIGYLGVVLVIILLSMTLHEAMHGFMSYWLGDDTAKNEGRLTLNPLAHIDPFLTILLPLLLALSGGPIFGGAKPVPFSPYKVKYEEFGAMLVGLAGPLTNLVIAFVCFGVAQFTGGGVRDIFDLATIINLGFFVFNMLPVPPLDGSRVLYYLAPDGARKVMASMEQYGIILVFVLVFFFSTYVMAILQTVMTFFLHIFAAIFGAVL